MVEIRRGVETDRTQLRAIQRATLAEPWPELLETALGGTPPLYVATEGDTAVGYGIVIPDSGSVAYLPELAIHPQRQGEGHGSALLRSLCTRLREDGYKELQLTVRLADQEALAFYRSHGFEKRERLRAEFEAGDGLLLGKKL